MNREQSQQTFQRPRSGAGLIMAALLTAAGCATPPDPALVRADALKRGDELAAQDKPADAARAYRTALDVDPRDGVTRLKLSHALREAQDWTAAAREGIRAADLLPDDLDAQIWGIRMRLTQSQFVDALQRAEPLQEKHPDNAELLIQRGNATAHLITSTWGLEQLSEALRVHADYEWKRQSLRIRTEEPEDRDAETLYRQALALDPESEEARFALVSFLWASGQPEAAEPLLRRLADELIAEETWASTALGRFYLKAGRLADAEKYLAAARTAGDDSAGLDLADVYLQLGRGEDARRILTGDGSIEASLRLAEIERTSGRLAEARQQLDGILARDSAHAEAWRKKAELLLQMGDAAGSLAAARTAAERAPASADAQLILARALSATGDVKGSFDAFTEVANLAPNIKNVAREQARLALALGQERTAVDFARLAIRDDPNDRSSQANLATALFRLGDLDAAQRALAPLLTGSAVSADLLVLSGRILAGRGQSEAARSAFLRALKADAGEIDAVSGLVTLDLAAGRLDDARRRADEALRAHQDSPAHLRLSATVAVAERALPEAEAALRRARALAPSDVDTFLLLADVLGRQARAPEAIATLQEALAQHPASLPLQLALAGRFVADGRTADARKQYETTVAQFPDSPQAAIGLAALYAAQGEQLDLAGNLASTAKQRLPDDPAVSDTLGWVYVRRKMPTLGLPHLEDAVRAEPANALFQYHLGIAYAGVGNKARAQAALNRALSLDASLPHAAEARAALESLAQ